MLTRRHLLATTAAGVAAAATVPEAEAATPSAVLVMARAIDNIVGAFDPAQSYETSNNEACGNIYRKLIVPDPADANKLVGDLAESWQVSGDGLVFTFQLGRGVKFDNGNELTEFQRPGVQRQPRRFRQRQAEAARLALPFLRPGVDRGGRSRGEGA